MANLNNAFSLTKASKATKQGDAGYDNPRENIDPHIKTQAISAKEIRTGKLYFTKDTYLTYNSVSGHLEIWLGGVLVGEYGPIGGGDPF